MTNSKNKSTVDPASRDPFNQPTFLAAKANSREIEKQIRKNLQIDLSLHDEQADAQAAAGKARLAQVEEKIRQHDLVRDKSCDSRRLDETSIQLLRPDGQVKFPHPWPPQIPPGRTAGL